MVRMSFVRKGSLQMVLVTRDTQAVYNYSSTNCQQISGKFFSEIPGHHCHHLFNTENSLVWVENKNKREEIKIREELEYMTETTNQPSSTTCDEGYDWSCALTGKDN